MVVCGAHFAKEMTPFNFPQTKHKSTHFLMKPFRGARTWGSPQVKQMTQPLNKMKLYKYQLIIDSTFLSNNLILAVCRAHFAKEMTPFNFPRTRKGSFRSSTRAISIQNSSVVCSKASFSLTEYVSECSEIPNQCSF